MNKPVSCPLCGSDDLTELYSLSSSYVSNQLITESDTERFKQLKTKIEQIWSSQQAYYYNCRLCSFDFAYPFVAGDAEFYSLLYYSAGHYPADKWEYRITLSHIDNYIKTTSILPKVFEIGAGNGSFLKMAMNSGIPAQNIMATEYSEAGIKAIENLGIHCLSKDLNAVTTEDIPYKIDIVCLFQVLEHLSGIQNFFSKINQITNPGARLYISVPNSYLRRLLDRFGYFLDLPPIHVGRYNSVSLGTLAKSFGWNLTESMIQPTTFSVRAKKFLYTQFDLYQRYFKTEKIRIKILRLFLRYVIYSFIVLLNIRIIAGLRKSNLGTAHWFELVRVN